MKDIVRIFIALLLLASCSNYHIDEPEITRQELYDHLAYLASDSIKGRKPGTAGDKASADYIRNKFEELGLELICDDGYQEFDVLTDVKIGDNNSFSVNGKNAELHEDFIPLSMSENSSVESGICFAGYGFDIKDEKITWNDYENIQAEGKWLMILTADPETENTESLYTPYSDHRSKIITARDNKAAGVIFVEGHTINPDDILEFIDNKEATSGLPVIQISRSLANIILESKNITIEKLENKLMQSGKPNSMELDPKISVITDLLSSRVKTYNVVALLNGSDKDLRKEYIVVGGHYDHLGMGGQGSGSRSPENKAVHNGADDNASGVATIIEIAEKVASLYKESKRSIIFAAFGAEEMGLLGSKYFVENPPVNLLSIKTMLNIDMVGRLREDRSLQIGGTGTALETEELLKTINNDYDFKLALSSAGYGPSDHAAFYGKNIPVMFISTGAHLDYHTPADDIDRINFEGMTEIAKYISEICFSISKRDSSLSFQEAGPRTATSARQRFKVTLGIMPNFVSTDNNGLGVDFVTEGKPAHRGGMKKGDIIIAIDGMLVSNIYDYMARLTKLKAGQTISVEVLRNEKKELLLIQL